MHRTVQLNGVSRIGAELNGVEELAYFEPEEIELAFLQLGQPVDLSQTQEMNGIFAAIGMAVKGIVGGIKKVVGKIKENRANKQLAQQYQAGQLPPPQQFAPSPYARPQFAQPAFAPSFADQYATSPVQFTQAGGVPPVDFRAAETPEEKKKKQQTMLLIGGGILAAYLLTRKK